MIARPLIFVSHHHEDAGIAEIITGQLRRSFLGGATFFNASDQYRSVQPGDKWAEQILQALGSASVVLVIASPQGVPAPWVNFEAGGGWTTGARVIPCCVAGVTPSTLPTPLGQLQAIDLTVAPGVEALFTSIASAAELEVPINLDFEVIAQQIADADTKDRHPPRRDGFDANLEFVRFVGRDAWELGVQLVYPVFDFSAEARRRFEAFEGIKYDKPRERETGRGNNLIRPVAANDLRALSSIARLIGREGMFFYPVTDREACDTGGRFPAISFGMTSSDFTFLYVEQCKIQGVPPLFEPIQDGNGEARVLLANGKSYGYDVDCYGLVARVTPHPNHPERRWIFCAGLGPSGTEAAANYLNDNWKSLSQAAEARDFVAVVTCAPGNPSIVHADPAISILKDPDA